MGLQQPPSTSFLDRVHPVAGDALGDLGEQGLGVGEHHLPKLAVSLDLCPEVVGVHPRGDSARLGAEENVWKAETRPEGREHRKESGIATYSVDPVGPFHKDEGAPLLTRPTR
jgi:hypothetical protein